MWRPRVWDASAESYLTGLGTFTTMGGAAAKAEEVRRALAGSVYIAPTDATVLDEVRNYAEGRGRSYTTLLARVNRDRTFALVKLTELRRHHVQAHLRRQTGAPTTQRLHAKLLHAVLASAVEEGRITVLPMKRVDVPKAPKPLRDNLSVADVRKLAESMPGRYRLMVLLMGSAGLRISECVAVRESDIDYDRSTLHVLRQHDRRNRPVGLKSTADPRRVPLPLWLEMELAAHVEQYRSESGLLFTTRQDTPVNPTTWRALAWRKAVAAAGLPPTLRPHDLRHHAASSLIELGVPLTTVAKMLGHSVLVLSQTYAHSLPGADDGARMALEALWGTVREADSSRHGHAAADDHSL